MTTKSMLFSGDSWADINEEEEKKELEEQEKKCPFKKVSPKKIDATPKKVDPSPGGDTIREKKCSNGKTCLFAYYQYGIGSFNTDNKKKEIKHEIKCKFEHSPAEIKYFIDLAKELYSKGGMKNARVCVNGPKCKLANCRFNHSHDYLFT
jgi:hypothetical protein